MTLTLMMRTFFAALLLLSATQVHAQALAAAIGGGSYLTVGGGDAAFRARYDNRVLFGGYGYADLNLSPRLGAEAEVRLLRQHTDESVTESTYLAGIRFAPRPFHRISPYGKLLAGVGHITLPFHYADGNFFVLAPAAGIDLRLTDRIVLRAADIQYQSWQSFPYGGLHPYGVSAGLSFRLNGIAQYPSSHRRE